MRLIVDIANVDSHDVETVRQAIEDGIMGTGHHIITTTIVEATNEGQFAESEVEDMADDVYVLRRNMGLETGRRAR